MGIAFMFSSADRYERATTMAFATDNKKRSARVLLFDNQLVNSHEPA